MTVIATIAIRSFLVLIIDLVDVLLLVESVFRYNFRQFFIFCYIWQSGGVNLVSREVC